MQASPAMIVGAGGHAVSVAEAVRSAGYAIAAFVSEREAGGTLLGLPILSAIPDSHRANAGHVVIAIGDNSARARVWDSLLRETPEDRFPAICHASSVIADGTTLAPGCVVLQGAILANGVALGRGALVNTGAIVDHETTVAEFASLAPRAVTGGRVTIGARSAVSIGAVVRHGVTIGEDTVVGAAAYVHRDLPARVVAYGVPARIIRSREPGDPYLG